MDSQLWYLLNSGPGDFAFNMALDEALLESMPVLQSPVLRFYGWTQAAASFGYFQKYADVELLTPLRPLVRRPTGGGIVPHNADWTYSLVFPTNHSWYSLSARESYRSVHIWIQSAFSRLSIPSELAPADHRSNPGQCFQGYVQSDLLWNGQKLAGAAQRRRRDGLLIQGSIQPPFGATKRVAWEKAMCEAAAQERDVQWRVLQPDTTLLVRTQDLVQRKYSRPVYNQGR